LYPAVSERSDEQLVESALLGDEEAFAAIVHRYQRLMLSIGYAYLKDFEAAQDMAQEAFTLAYQRLGDLREPSQLRPWLGSVCRNRCLDVLRSEKPRMDAERLEKPVPGESWLARTAGNANLVEEIAFRERRGRLVAALEKLPDDYRQVMILRGIRDLSYAEIARIVGVNEGLVKVRIFRARRMLMEMLKDEER
jgi:RNA polymerase sigma factor (sigma-70 family)